MDNGLNKQAFTDALSTVLAGADQDEPDFDINADDDFGDAQPGTDGEMTGELYPRQGDSDNDAVDVAPVVADQLDPPMGDDGSDEIFVDQEEGISSSDQDIRFVPYNGERNARAFVLKKGSVDELALLLQRVRLRELGQDIDSPSSTADAQPNINPLALLVAGLAAAPFTATASVVNSLVAKHQHKRQTEQLNAGLTEASTSLRALSEGGFAKLLAKGGDIDQAKVDRLLRKPENQAHLDSLMLAMNKANQGARALVGTGMKNGATGDDIQEHAIKPIADFIQENERLLAALKRGDDESLLEKFDKQLNGIFDGLQRLLSRISEMIRGQSASAAEQGPRVG